MNRTFALVIAAAAAAIGCKHGTAQPSPYADDIGRLCDVLHLSGADTATPGQRPLMTAKWLGDNLQTPEAHQFLIKIQPLEGAAKAKALDDEAHQVGLAGCALSAEWRK